MGRTPAPGFPLESKAERWVAAFYAARGWSLDVPAPDLPPEASAPAPSDAMIEVRKMRATIEAAQTRLWETPPEGPDPGNWADVEGADERARMAEEDGDAVRAKEFLIEMALALRAVAKARGDSAGQKPVVADDDGGPYRWSPVDLDGTGRKVFAVGLTQTGGRFSGMNMAGRPPGKHAGQQGQHVTAFVSVRAAAVGATCGHTPPEAQANLAHLFAGLLRFPAFGKAGPGEGPDAGTMAIIRGLAAGDADVWRLWPPEKAIKLYAELRDALPGATLPPEFKEDTDGHGEGSAARNLDKWDNFIGDGAAALEQDVAAGIVADMLVMLDRRAIEALADTDRMQHALDSHVLGMAQAWPRLFKAGIKGGGTVGAALATAAFDPDERPDAGKATGKRKGRDGGKDALTAYPAAPADLMERAGFCADLPFPEGTARPASVENFNASLETPAGAPLRLAFTGRPTGAKRDGPGQGDHMTAMRMMQPAISTALLDQDTDLPTTDRLVARIETVLARFNPSRYRDLLSDMPDEKGDDSDLAVPRLRLPQLEALHEKLQEACNEMRALPVPVAVDLPSFLSLAQEVLRLVDHRPTAVVTGSAAGGHGEAGAAKSLTGCEAALAKGAALPEDPLVPLLGLFDSGAAALGFSQLAADPPRQQAFATLVSEEFVWFAERGFPRCVAHVGVAVLFGAVRNLVVTRDENDERKDIEGFVPEGRPIGDVGSRTQPGRAAKRGGDGVGAVAKKARKAPDDDDDEDEDGSDDSDSDGGDEEEGDSESESASESSDSQQSKRQRTGKQADDEE